MKVRVYVGTTEGPVAIERITREGAPNSAMCIGRSTREATASTGYEAFVKQPSGVIERELGPYSPGAFRLDVSADIGDGDSWQLGVFVAHALAVEGRLAEYPEDADAVLWLTGEVANDLEVRPVGHVPDKIRAARVELETLSSGGTSVKLIVPKANSENIEQSDLPSGITWVAVSRIDEALEAAGLSGQGSRQVGEGQKAVIPTPPLQNSARMRSSARRWGYAVVTVLILAAAAWAYPFAERLLTSKSPEPSVKPTPSIVSELNVPAKLTDAAPPRPASRSATGNGRSDASKPAEDEINAREAAVLDNSQPAMERMPPTTLDGEAQQPTSNLPNEASSTLAPVPKPASDSASGTASASVPAPNTNAILSHDTASNSESPIKTVIEPPRHVVRLVIRERRAPLGANCAAVHFGRVTAATNEVPRLGSDRFAPSLHEGLCGLEFAIINSGPPAYVAAFTTMASGRFRDVGRAPEALGGGFLINGETSWTVNVARRLRGPIDYRLVAVVSDRPVQKITTQLRTHADPVAAARGVSDIITVHHASHRVDP